MIVQVYYFILSILKEWYAEIIAALIGMAFIWVLGLLPPKLQYHKRLNFALKISKAISKIDLSIETNKHMSIKEVQTMVGDFLKNDFLEDVSLQRDLLFNSNKSGTSYKVSSVKDDETERSFITISAHNAFNVGLFGKIKGLNYTVNELQTILEGFNPKRNGTDKITVHITITPRRVSSERDRMQVKYDDSNFSTTYTMKNIKLVNNGMSSLRENINQVFYEWMTSLL